MKKLIVLALASLTLIGCSTTQKKEAYSNKWGKAKAGSAKWGK